MPDRVRFLLPKPGSSFVGLLEATYNRCLCYSALCCLLCDKSWRQDLPVSIFEMSVQTTCLACLVRLEMRVCYVPELALDALTEAHVDHLVSELVMVFSCRRVGRHRFKYSRCIPAAIVLNVTWECA